MNRLLSLIFSILLLASAMSPVYAAESIPRELEGVGIQERLGDQIDLNLTFRDETGTVVPLRSVIDGRKPTLLFLAYYGCPNLCGLFLNGAISVLKQMDWIPGKEFNIVTISIDPTEEPDLAAAKRTSHVEALKKSKEQTEIIQKGWHFWVNDKAAEKESSTVNVKTLANQVGFGYKWDKQEEQYAHAAAIIALTPSGRISRYLYGIDFRPKDLRLALVEAGGDKIGTALDHFLLFCYSYDPKTRRYGLYARNLMKAGGALTVLLLGGFLVNLIRRSRRNDTGGV